MTTTIHFNKKNYTADLARPIDISMPLAATDDQANCFYAPLFEAMPVKAGDFVGSTAAGGPVNFYNVQLNPHGNGTHTECVGHIARPEDFGVEKEFVFTINDCLRRFHFMAKLVSVFPTKQPNGDRVIMLDQIKEVLEKGEVEALVLRTLPNDEGKLQRSYSGTNPPYLHHEAVEYMVECGVQHLLLDLPSVDREEDGGQLLSHKAFWQYAVDGTNAEKLRRLDDFGRKNCTITELIFVTNEIKDGLYLLNLQIASLEIDASPSKPVLYEVVLS